MINRELANFGVQQMKTFVYVPTVYLPSILITLLKDEYHNEEEFYRIIDINDYLRWRESNISITTLLAVLNIHYI